MTKVAKIHGLLVVSVSVKVTRSQKAAMRHQTTATPHRRQGGRVGVLRYLHGGSARLRDRVQGHSGQGGQREAVVQEEEVSACVMGAGSQADSSELTDSSRTARWACRLANTQHPGGWIIWCLLFTGSKDKGVKPAPC